MDRLVLRTGWLFSPQLAIGGIAVDDPAIGRLGNNDGLAASPDTSHGGAERRTIARQHEETVPLHVLH